MRIESGSSSDDTKNRKFTNKTSSTQTGRGIDSISSTDLHNPNKWDSRIFAALSAAQEVNVVSFDTGRNVSIKEQQEQELEKYTALKDLPDDATVGSPSTSEPYQVFVTDPDDYPLLLSRSFRAIGIGEEEMKPYVDEISYHEREHFDRAAQEPDLYPKLGVSFLKNAESGTFMLAPLTLVEGDVTARVSREIASAPTNLSDGDKHALGLDATEMTRLHEEALAQNREINK